MFEGYGYIRGPSHLNTVCTEAEQIIVGVTTKQIHVTWHCQNRGGRSQHQETARALDGGPAIQINVPDRIRDRTVGNAHRQSIAGDGIVEAKDLAALPEHND